MIWVGQNSIADLSLLVIYVCLKRGKNLTLKTCAPDFSARSMTRLYTKITGVRAVSLFDFFKTWQVCHNSYGLMRFLTIELHVIKKDYSSLDMSL